MVVNFMWKTLEKVKFNNISIGIIFNHFIGEIMKKRKTEVEINSENFHENFLKQVWFCIGFIAGIATIFAIVVIFI